MLNNPIYWIGLAHGVIGGIVILNLLVAIAMRQAKKQGIDFITPFLKLVDKVFKLKK